MPGQQDQTPPLGFPGGLPSALASTPPHHAGAEPMPIPYARTPILCKSDDDLFYAFVRLSVDASGVVSPPAFWGQAAGGWGPTFDASAHVRPFARMAASGSVNGRWQSAPVPWDVATDPEAHMVAYTKDATGAYVEWGFPGGGAAEALAVGVR